MLRSTLLPLALALVAGCGADAVDRGAQTAGPPAGMALQGHSADGGEFTLRQVAGAPAVLVFLRGSFCPLCVDRLRQLSAYEGAYRAAGARVVAVTLDRPEVAASTSHDLDLDAPLVSADAETFRRWGVWPAGQPMPRPGEFVLDAGGRVRWSRVGEDAADLSSDVALLAVLDSLHASGALARR